MTVFIQAVKGSRPAVGLVEHKGSAAIYAIRQKSDGDFLGSETVLIVCILPHLAYAYADQLRRIAVGDIEA